mmetsp:Transcript_32527/g.97048  ORF Transcript_32527/g.97048 Transcript_32527/m.97048 type:complete len:246 (-) Transcript_32527:194-931(-)
MRRLAAAQHDACGGSMRRPTRPRMCQRSASAGGLRTLASRSLVTATAQRAGWHRQQAVVQPAAAAAARRHQASQPCGPGGLASARTAAAGWQTCMPWPQRSRRPADGGVAKRPALRAARRGGKRTCTRPLWGCQARACPSKSRRRPACRLRRTRARRLPRRAGRRPELLRGASSMRSLTWQPLTLVLPRRVSKLQPVSRRTVQLSVQPRQVWKVLVLPRHAGKLTALPRHVQKLLALPMRRRCAP